jgi:hypothetical protein
VLELLSAAGLFAAEGGTMAAEGQNGGDDGMMRIGKRCYVSNLAWKTRYSRTRRPAALASKSCSHLHRRC